MSRTRVAAKGTMANIVQFILQISLQVLLAPVILAVAGRETMGAYAALLQAIGYLILLDLGFSFTLNRYLPQAFGVDDGGEYFRAVMGTGRTFLLGVGVAFAAAAVALSFGIGPFLSLSPQVEEKARIAVLLLAGWGLIRFPLSVYGSALIGVQDLAFRHLLAAISNAIRLVASLILLYLGFDLVGLIVGNILGELADLVICRLRFRRLYPQRNPNWGIRNRKLFNEMLRFSFQAMLIMVAGRLIFFTDKLVIGALMGVVSVSIFYTTQLPAVLGSNFIWKFADNASPAINELYARKEWDRLRNAYLRLQRYTLLMAFPLLLGLVLLNQQIVTIWVGPENYAGLSVTIWLAAFAFIVSTSHVNYLIILATGRIRGYTIVNIVEGLTSLGLSIMLGKIWGLPGVALAVFLGHLLNLVYVQWKAQQELSLSWGTCVSQCLGPAAAISLGSGLLLLSAHHLFPPTNLLILLGVTAAFLIIHALLTFFFGLFPPERKLVLGWVHLGGTTSGGDR